MRIFTNFHFYSTVITNTSNHSLKLTVLAKIIKTQQLKLLIKNNSGQYLPHLHCDKAKKPQPNNGCQKQNRYCKFKPFQEPGMSTGISHPKTGPVSYSIMLPNESAFRKVSHKVCSQSWISSCQRDHYALLTQLSKHDQITSLPLFKFPAEPSCVCNTLVALSSNPHP